MASVQISVSAPQSPASITSTEVEAPFAPRKPAPMRSRLGGISEDVPRVGVGVGLSQRPRRHAVNVCEIEKRRLQSELSCLTSEMTSLMHPFHQGDSLATTARHRVVELNISIAEKETQLKKVLERQANLRETVADARARAITNDLANLNL